MNAMVTCASCRAVRLPCVRGPSELVAEAGLSYQGRRSVRLLGNLLAMQTGTLRAPLVRRLGARLAPFTSPSFLRCKALLYSPHTKYWSQAGPAEPPAFQVTMPLALEAPAMSSPSAGQVKMTPEPGTLLKSH